MCDPLGKAGDGDACVAEHHSAGSVLIDQIVDQELAFAGIAFAYRLQASFEWIRLNGEDGLKGFPVGCGYGLSP